MEMHYVTTLEEAREIIDAHKRFYISNCNCREHRGPCSRSRMDVCLQFKSKTVADGSGKRKATREEVEDILHEAQFKSLIARPFRNMDNMSVIDGICFCCDDCCGYFTGKGREVACDKGAYIEKTNLDACNGCGACAEACFFKARAPGDETVTVNEDLCYGCGNCVPLCPSGCISMIKRG